jgi:hypothetical protein
MVSGFWFGSIEETSGNQFIENLIVVLNSYLVFGFLVLLIGALIIIGLLALFGGQIGKYDLNLVYGRILKD